MLRSRLLILVLFAAYSMLFSASKMLSSALSEYVPLQVTLDALFLMNPIPHIMIVIMDMNRLGMDIELFVILATNLAFWLLIGYFVGVWWQRSRRRRERRRNLRL